MCQPSLRHDEHFQALLTGLESMSCSAVAHVIDVCYSSAHMYPDISGLHPSLKTSITVMPGCMHAGPGVAAGGQQALLRVRPPGQPEQLQSDCAAVDAGPLNAANSTGPAQPAHHAREWSDQLVATGGSRPAAGARAMAWKCQVMCQWRMVRWGRDCIGLQHRAHSKSCCCITHHSEQWARARPLLLASGSASGRTQLLEVLDSLFWRAGRQRDWRRALCAERGDRQRHNPAGQLACASTSGSLFHTAKFAQQSLLPLFVHIKARSSSDCLWQAVSNSEMGCLTWRAQGLKFNSPNDVVVSGNGSVFFTDPSTGVQQKFRAPEQLGEYVWRWDLRSKAVSPVASGFTVVRPPCSGCRLSLPTPACLHLQQSHVPSCMPAMLPHSWLPSRAGPTSCMRALPTRLQSSVLGRCTLG